MFNSALANTIYNKVISEFYVTGHTMNLFLNKHALEIIDELKENIGESLSVVFKKIMNEGFGRIPTKFWLQD